MKDTISKTWMFIVNLIVPGLGTIIIGKYELGIIQLVLTTSISLMLFAYKELPSALTAMIILLASAWLWVFITGIRTLKEK